MVPGDHIVRWTRFSSFAVARLRLQQVAGWKKVERLATIFKQANPISLILT
jgi:hypothetical protein